MSLRGVVVIILALGISIALILLVVETMLHVGPVSAQESTVLSTVMGATIGAIATYLGGHAAEGGGSPRGEPEPPGDEPAEGGESE